MRCATANPVLPLLLAGAVLELCRGVTSPALEGFAKSARAREPELLRDLRHALVRRQLRSRASTALIVDDRRKTCVLFLQSAVERSGRDAELRRDPRRARMTEDQPAANGVSHRRDEVVRIED